VGGLVEHLVERPQCGEKRCARERGRRTFTIKLQSYAGGVAEYDLRPEGSRLLVREIRSGVHLP